MGSSRQFEISPFQSDLLDLARWLAAFLVVVEHLRSFMFIDYGTGGRMNLFGKAFYFMTGFGHSAVMIFFVMSGFLVGGKVLQRLSPGNFFLAEIRRGSQQPALCRLCGGPPSGRGA